MIKIYNKLLERFGHQLWWPTKTGRRFEIIAGAILTQNTNWKNVEKAIENLIENKLLSKEAIIHTPLDKIAETIKPAGYYNQKAKKLKAFASYTGKIKRDEILKIWGIGPETADSILLYAYNKPYFVVDAYTKRIFYRLGELDGKEDYEDIRKLFEKKLPRSVDIYQEFHALIVELAKKNCRKDPICENCPLTNICKVIS